MARPKALAPARQYHLSGQSVVQIGGQTIYLGKHDSPESIARYAVLIGIYQANGLTLPDGFDVASLDERAAFLLGMSAPVVDQTKQPKLVKHVTALCREHIKKRYANNQAETYRMTNLCDDLDQQEDHRKADEYGPLALQEQRQRWIDGGMRPDELCRLRPMDIDRTGETWIYRIVEHKTAKKGKLRVVPLLTDARDAITDYLNRSPESYCFSPMESVAWWHAQKRSERKTKVQPSQRSRASENPRKKPGMRYTATSYRQSIQRAAKRAGVEQWHPYQIRHLSLTIVRDVIGIEAAQAFAGNSQASMTQHYAKQSEAKAIEAAKAAPKL